METIFVAQHDTNGCSCSETEKPVHVNLENENREIKIVDEWINDTNNFRFSFKKNKVVMFTICSGPNRNAFYFLWQRMWV